MCRATTASNETGERVSLPQTTTRQQETTRRAIDFLHMSSSSSSGEAYRPAVNKRVSFPQRKFRAQIITDDDDRSSEELAQDRALPRQQLAYHAVDYHEAGVLIASLKSRREATARAVLAEQSRQRKRGSNDAIRLRFASFKYGEMHELEARESAAEVAEEVHRYMSDWIHGDGGKSDKAGKRRRSRRSTNESGPETNQMSATTSTGMSDGGSSSSSSSARPLNASSVRTEVLSAVLDAQAVASPARRRTTLASSSPTSAAATTSSTCAHYHSSCPTLSTTPAIRADEEIQRRDNFHFPRAEEILPPCLCVEVRLKSKRRTNGGGGHSNNGRRRDTTKVKATAQSKRAVAVEQQKVSPVTVDVKNTAAPPARVSLPNKEQVSESGTATMKLTNALVALRGIQRRSAAPAPVA